MYKCAISNKIANIDKKGFNNSLLKSKIKLK